jgi:hypothetical protein
MRTQSFADTHSLKPLVLRLRQEAGACRFPGPARLLEELAWEVDRIGYYGKVVVPLGRTSLEEFLLLQDLVDFFETAMLCPVELDAHSGLIVRIRQWLTSEADFVRIAPEGLLKAMTQAQN